MNKNDQVTRILKIINLLENSVTGVSLKQVADYLNGYQIKVSERTLRRDFDAIESCHFPIEKITVNDEIKWKLNFITKITSKISFNYQDLIALFIAKESLSVFNGSPIIYSINNLFDKIENVLGKNIKIELQNLKKYIEFKPNSTWQSGVSQEILDTLHSATSEGHVLKFLYKSNSGDSKNKISERKVGPETIYFADSSIYLIGKDLNDQKIKFFSIARIIEAEMTEEIYESSDFDIDKFVNDNFGVLAIGQPENVKVFISDPIANYIAERRWHPSQTLTRVENGVILQMNVRINDEFVRWILGLGKWATVESPNSLISEVRLNIIEMEKKYQIKKAI